MFAQYNRFDIWLWFLTATLVVLLIRMTWFWSAGRLSGHPEWTATERHWGRLVAGAFAAGALVSGITAVYVATRVPWVDNLSSLLAQAPQGVAMSTAAYLFSLPLSLAVFAAMHIDPWGVRQIRFKGALSRTANMRAAILIGLFGAAYSIWLSIGALSAARQ
jgi:hypothetical protein